MRIRFVVAALLALGSATAAAAQPSQEPRSGWTFRPSFTFGGAVDDNVLLVGDETKPLLPTDYLTALTPAGLVDYRGPRLTFGSSYSGSFVFYRQLSELNSLDQNGRAQLNYRATRRVAVSLAQSYAQSQTTDLFEFIGVPFTRIGNRRGETNAGMEIRPTAHTLVNTSYTLRVVDFDDAVEYRVAFPGGHEHQFSGAVTQQLNSRLSLGGTYGLRKAVIKNDPASVLIHHAAGTVAYKVNEFVDLDGSVGVSHLGAVTTVILDPTSLDPTGRPTATLGEIPPRTGLAFRGGASVRQEYFTVSGYYERSVVPSFGFGGTFQNEELAGNISGAFARRRAYWQAGAAWRDNDPLELVDPRPSRRTIWLSSRLGYALSPWLRVEGYYTRARQDSATGLGYVHRNRLGFEIITTKPFRVAP